VTRHVSTGAALVVLAVATAACAGATRARPIARASTPAVVHEDAASAPTLPGWDELSRPDAGTVRERMRGDLARDDANGPLRLRIPVGEDGCFRASVAATDFRRAWFEDAAGPRGAETLAPGLAPPRGPVCARAGESLVLVVDARSARAILWQY
jgi:hypothetical protein